VTFVAEDFCVTAGFRTVDSPDTVAALVITGKRRVRMRRRIIRI
jgi:hypothetical protein